MPEPGSGEACENSRSLRKGAHQAAGCLAVMPYIARIALTAKLTVTVLFTRLTVLCPVCRGPSQPYQPSCKPEYQSVHLLSNCHKVWVFVVLPSSMFFRAICPAVNHCASLTISTVPQVSLTSPGMFLGPGTLDIP
jgi:hypothetical protein